MRDFPRTPAIPMLATIVFAGVSLARPVAAQVTTTSSSTSTSVSASTTTSTSITTTTTIVPQALRCKNRLLGRATKLARKRSRCDVRLRKRTAKGKPFDDVACEAKAVERYDRTTTGSARFARGCLTCTLDGVETVRDGLLALADDLGARIGCAPEVPIAERVKCETKLLKAAAKYQAALMQCRKEAALAAFAGEVPGEMECRQTARTRYDAKVKALSCPPCVDAARVADAAREAVDEAIALAHCPCLLGDASACPECQVCDVSDGCVPANERQACGRNGCVPESCIGGACVAGDPVTCTDGDVCTVDVCVDTDDTCVGAGCCTHEPLCDPTTLGDCVIECTCDPAVGCSCRCEEGCPVPACVIFTGP